MNTSYLSRIDLQILNQIYILALDILKLLTENIHLEICYFIFLPNRMIFSKGVFKKR